MRNDRNNSLNWYNDLERKTLNNLVFKDFVYGENGRLLVTDDLKEKFYKAVIEYLNGLTDGELEKTAVAVNAETRPGMEREETVRSTADALWGLQCFDSPEVKLVEPSLNTHVPVGDEIKMIKKYFKGEFIGGKSFSGYFDITENGLGVIRLQALAKTPCDALCSRRMINDYNLKEGDFITGRVHYEESLRCFCMYFIDSLNGRAPGDPIPDYAKPRCDEPHRRILMGDTIDGLGAYVNLFSPIYFGQSLLISYDGAANAPERVASLAHAIDRNDCFDEVTTLFLGECEKTYARVRSVVSPSGFVAPGKTDEFKYVVRRAIKYVRGEASRCRRVCLLVNDVSQISHDAELCAELYSANVAYTNGGSVTVVGFVDLETAGAGYAVAKRLADGELRVKFNSFSGTVGVDVERSFSSARENSTEYEWHVLLRLREMINRGRQAEVDEILKANRAHEALCSAVLSLK